MTFRTVKPAQQPETAAGRRLLASSWMLGPGEPLLADTILAIEAEAARTADDRLLEALEDVRSGLQPAVGEIDASDLLARIDRAFCDDSCHNGGCIPNGCDRTCHGPRFHRPLPAADRAEPVGPTYAQRVQAMADALHEDCRLEWQAIAVVDPGRLVTQHMADAHYGKAHDLVRRLWPEPATP